MMPRPPQPPCVTAPDGDELLETDAAVLGGAGIPSVLFGPGGAGLHSTDEFVLIEDVVACRDILARLAIDNR